MADMYIRHGMLYFKGGILPASRRTIYLAAFFVPALAAFLLYWVHHPAILQFCYAMVSLAFLTTLAIYIKKLHRQPILCASACLAALVLCVFLLQQQPQNYTYDRSAHIATIAYYSKDFNRLQPITPRSNEAHQPPLYYLVAGQIYRLSAYFDQKHKLLLSIASLNYFCFCMFLLYGIAFIRYTITHPFLMWLGIAALLAWPANLLHGFRISNDIPLYLAFSGSCYHFMRWYKEERIAELRYTVLWMALAFAIKNSALLLPIIFTTLLARKYCRGRNPLRWPRQLIRALRAVPLKPLRLALILLAVALASGLGRNAYNAYVLGHTTIIEGKASARSQFRFDLAPLEFDVFALMATPYAYDKAGRDNLFWNMFIRTLSFGEYNWNGIVHAKALNFFMVCLWAFMAAAMLLLWKQKRPLGWAGFYGVHIGLILAGIAFIRMYFNGFVPWADARHVYSIIVFFLVAYLSLLEQFRTADRSAYALGVALLAAYLYLSLVHIALQLSFDNILPIPKGGYKAAINY